VNLKHMEMFLETCSCIELNDDEEKNLRPRRKEMKLKLLL